MHAIRTIINAFLSIKVEIFYFITNQEFVSTMMKGNTLRFIYAMNGNFKIEKMILYFMFIHKSM